MSEQPKDELALVLSRIQALSRPRAQPPEQAPAADIPVLNDVYAGGGAFSAVDIDQLFAPYFEDEQAVAEDEWLADEATGQEAFPEEPAVAGDTADLPHATGSGIRFLPIEDENSEAGEDEEVTLSPAELLQARQEVVTAVMADMQPLIADAIRQALMREIQALGPKLSTDLEETLSETVQQRIVKALKPD